MGINEYLTEELIAEYAAEGKKISYELAWLVVMGRMYDGFARDCRKVYPTMSAETIAAKLDVSVRFVEVTLARYGMSEMEEPPSGFWEQIAEMRKIWALIGGDQQVDFRRYIEEEDMRIREKIGAVDVFLIYTDFSDDKIAEVVDVSVCFVEEIKAIWAMRKNKEQGVLHNTR